MPSDLDELIRSAQRKLALARISREMAWRLAGVLTLVVAGAIIQRWTRAPVFPALCAIGLVAGAIDFALRVRIPTRLDTAIEIDRQYELNELLSSAFLMARASRADCADRAKLGEARTLEACATHRPDAGFASAVAMQAREQATRISIAQLNGGNYGARPWVATLLLLGLVPLVYPPAAIQEALPQVAESAARSEQIASLRQQQMSAGHVVADGRGSSGTKGNPDSAISEERTQTQAVGSSHQSTGDLSGNSAGAGLATGGAQHPPIDSEHLSGRPAGQVGLASSVSGNGVGEAQPGDPRGTEGAGIAARSEIPGTPTLRGNGNTSLIPSAHLWQQQIPSEYHDVIKAYFDR